MYLNEKKLSGLKCPDNKKPLKGKTAAAVLFRYMKDNFSDLEGQVWGCHNNLNNYSDIAGIYAARVTLTNSGNEPRVYGWVFDQNGNALYVADVLDETPDAFARVAALCGAFLDAFNCYMDINA